jgi:hypothetical protein
VTSPLTTIIFGNQDITSQLSHKHLSLSISEHDHSCGCDHALFLVLKLSYGLVWTCLWAHPNGNLVLNCVDSPRHFLRTKVARWKEHFIIRISKRPLCITRRNGWCITRGTQSERRMLHLESCCYNKPHSGPKLTTSLKLMNISLSLFISNSCLTFLASACISFTPNWVCSLVRVYHWAISLWVRKCLPTTIAL